MAQTAQKMRFEAETQKILDLMVSSVYSKKEIFLRELISNSSDALDKLRFKSLTQKNLVKGDEKPEIRLEADPKKRTLAVHDNGIGMTKKELIENIGTIAKSGTEELIQKMQKQKNKEHIAEFIGKFGVGFYSVFMVTDRVEIITLKAGEKQAFQWESKGDGTYTIQDGSRDKNGTSVILYLKKSDPEDGLEDFTEPFTLKNIVKQYSDFISYPIVMKEETEEVEKDKDGKPIEGGKKNKIIEDKTLNSMKPIWTRPKNEVKKEEYNEFYKYISHDWNEPFRTITFQAEGRIEYTALLFLPSKAPFDLFYQNYKSGLRLYVKRVLIVEDMDELLPTYLRFVKGVVDSSALSLNISRELLQKDVHISVIKKGLTNKVISTLKQIFEKERDKYLEFWKEFGLALKEGVSSDFENKDKLVQLLLYPSSFSDDKLTSLKEYVGRMLDDQKSIYYVTGDSREVAESSPHLETFKRKGYEILYMLDPLDEFVTQSIGEFESKKIISVEEAAKELVDEKEVKKDQEKMADFLKTIQSALDAHIKEVQITKNLISYPACVIRDDAGLSLHLEKLLRKSGQNMPPSKRILQLNPDHPIIQKLHEKFKLNKDDPTIKEYAELLHNYAIIAEGGDIVNTNNFGKLMSKIMEKAI